MGTLTQARITDPPILEGQGKGQPWSTPQRYRLPAPVVDPSLGEIALVELDIDHLPRQTPADNPAPTSSSAAFDGMGGRSAAIPIVRPPSRSAAASPSQDSSHSGGSGDLKRARKDSLPKQIKQCRNIALYGSCKYEGKGCIYNHAKDSSGNPIQSSPPSAPSSPKPSPQISKVLSSFKNAPVFVPKSVAPSEASESVFNPPSSPSYGSSSRPSSPSKLGTTTPVYSSQDSRRIQSFANPAKENPPDSIPESYEFPNPNGENGYSSLPTPSLASSPSISGPMQSINPYAQDQGMSLFQPYGYDPSGMDMEPYFAQMSMMNDGLKSFVRQPLQYHLYAPPLPHVSNLHPHQLAVNAFFMNEEIREDLLKRNEKIWEMPMGAAAEVVRAEGKLLGNYYGLLPLDTNLPGDRNNREAQARLFGYPTWVYKAGCEMDGKMYVLRRVEGFRLQQEAAIGVIEKWRRIRHPGIVSVREAFTTRAFGDQSIVFVYDYHPAATTLMEMHLTPKPPVMRNGRMAPVSFQITERVMWTYIVQIANAIKTVHGAGLAVRTIDATKILVTGKNRIRLNCCGMLDVIAYDGGQNLVNQQQEDLVNFGLLILCLACNSLASVHNIIKSVEHLSRQYSPDIQKIVLFLISKAGPRKKTIEEVLQMIGSRVWDELNSTFNQNDLLESDLMKELENARLVRLLCKFGFINERPEFDHDPRWSETGDRYIIKLFRDYVFHQIDEHGKPVVDLSHVLTCLNKLDAGVDEKIMLVSRDEQSCLIVSYREIKSCIEGAYRDLSRR